MQNGKKATYMDTDMHNIRVQIEQLVNHLCQFWRLPSEVEDVLLLAKVLDDNLETVWPGVGRI